MEFKGEIEEKVGAPEACFSGGSAGTGRNDAKTGRGGPRGGKKKNSSAQGGKINPNERGQGGGKKTYL